ncbi:extracellular solute-binding protein [Streptomyces sp. CBMA152]|uniref:extracellular solute-binding protein n=1 Tax=Streptomyces sp. CBMA152 TaxID=1896312 RepID=UPI001660BB8D|nr:extracellular solute-binding protein [Streptomyces sp. CBMA152]
MTVGLSGCGSDSGSGSVTLKLVAADYDIAGGDSTKAYWHNVVSEFEKKNPGIKVDVSVYSWDVVDAKVAEMVKAGNAPDIAQIGAYSDYAASGKLYAVDQMLSIPVQANFLAPLADAGEMKRTQYGIPFVASTRLLFYNKTLFKKAHIEPPTTWAQLEADAKALKAKGVKTPFALPLGSEEAQAETMMWLLSGGGGYVNQVAGYDIDSPENVKTFQWLKKDLVQAGLTGPVAPGKLNRQAAFDAFAKGDVGMLNGHPSLMGEARKKGVDYGMVPLPGVEGKAKAAMGVADWIMGFKQNGHREQIGKFLDFTFNDQNVSTFADKYDLLPATRSASQAMQKDGKHQDLDQFLAALPTSELPPVGKTSWPRVSEAIKKRIGAAVQENDDPKAVLEGIAKVALDAESAE